ncbi:MAG: type II toxin-antitoxin system Phd/YefM family antitoxin [Gemmatimonadota bacterium]
MSDEHDADARAGRELRRERRFQLQAAQLRRQLAEAAVRQRARREGWLDLAPPDGASERVIRARALRAIGIRAAKTKLGELVRDIRVGREWLITDRGRPVARLVPVTLGDLSLAERLRQLQVANLLEPARSNRRFPEPVPLEQGAAAQGG